MPRSARSSSPAVNDPATLPESTRDYYRSIWGFDPVADCHILSSGSFWYEECFPLPEDLPLHAVGIKICARVDWEGEDVHNRILFRRIDDKGRRRKRSVECTHTVVYTGPASDALTFAEDFETFTNMTQADRARLIQKEKLVTLPPWEHFAALKSYVAAVADMCVIALLRQSIIASTESADGLPFGFNAEMQEQVARALRAIAPRALILIYRDLTCEFLDTHPPVALIAQWMDRSNLFEGNSIHKHWGFLLRHVDTHTLVYWFRYTRIADRFQNHLFNKPALLAKAQAIAPDLPWDSLHHEWEARSAAERMDFITETRHFLKNIPPYDVLAREPFCDYTFPRDILSPDSTSTRRSRVQAYLCQMTKAYTETDVGEPPTDHYLDWAQKVSTHLDDFLTAPFPVDRVRPEPIHHWDNTLKRNVGLTPAEVVDSIEHGDHYQRRDAVLCYPVPPELQEKLAIHWDFATRLALVGNPGTRASVIATLAQDSQPCVRFAADARVRRGAASFEPRFGEILDPGEMMWLLSAHPGIFFQFGVTAWGDGSDAYRDWFNTRFRENKELKHLLGELYAWACSGGIFWEEDERGPHGSHLAYYGLTQYACGQMPCLYLGLHFLGDQSNPLFRFNL